MTFQTETNAASSNRKYSQQRSQNRSKEKQILLIIASRTEDHALAASPAFGSGAVITATPIKSNHRTMPMTSIYTRQIRLGEGGITRRESLNVRFLVAHVSVTHRNRERAVCVCVCARWEKTN